MDAPDDRDLTLQRASADLLAEISTSLHRFLCITSKDGRLNDQTRGRIARKSVREHNITHLVKLLEPFQEWPQLLDPRLSSFLPSLNAAFIDYLWNHRSHYFAPRRRDATDVVPLPRGICKILYTFCKIRGEKVICQFLSNEPKYLDSMLDAFHTWNQVDENPPGQIAIAHGPMVWEERYIMLLWLSHLMLTPFPLVTISSNGPTDDSPATVLHISSSPGTPAVARRIAQICACHLSAASREREAARRLLVRLALRPDMRECGLLESLIRWSISFLRDKNLSNTIYAYIGILSFLNGVVASAATDLIVPFLIPLFKLIQDISMQESAVFVAVFSSALGRRLLIKLLRSITLQARQTDGPASPSHSMALMDTFLDDVVDQLLTLLADKDTPVRYAASKALSIIATKLEPALTAEIVGAIIGSLDEDVFWEEVSLKGTSSQPNTNNVNSSALKRNLTAVNPLRWQGLILTLSHLIYRRAPSPEDLPGVLNALVIALSFEQRSSVGTSIGASVRDAACFGIWALARRYTSDELLAVDPSTVHSAADCGHASSILQVLSNETVVAATLDVSGNIRRGASAALQEMIGRHPDTIKEGIPLVQTVDYHAVAARSRAILEVAVGASGLDESYRHAILHGLLQWRGLGSPDAQTRRFAASAIGILATSRTASEMETTLSQVQELLRGLHTREIEKRHGLLLSLAAIINEATKKGFHKHRSGFLAELWDVFRSTCPLSQTELTSFTLRPDLTGEAACALISALSLASVASGSSPSRMQLPSDQALTSCLDILNLSLLRTEEHTVEVVSETAANLFETLNLEQRISLIEKWAAPLLVNGLKEPRSSGKFIANIAALGAVFQHFLSPITPEIVRSRQLIIDALLCQMKPTINISSRVAAIKSLSSGILSCDILTTEITEILLLCLNDYTTDRRGDIGSLVRLEAIDAIGVALSRQLLCDVEPRRSVLAKICGLAVERLDKIRFRAWTCLHDHWALLTEVETPSTHSLQDVHFTSSSIYFDQMISLYSLGYLRVSLLEGYVSAAGAGSDSLLRSSRFALVSYAEQFSTKDLIQFCDHLSTVIGQNLSNDRILVPALLVVGFLFDAGVFEPIREAEHCWRNLFVLVQQSHYKSGNIHKLEAAVKVYTGLARTNILRANVIGRLCGMLLHSFPSIRKAAAVGLFIITDLQKLRSINWSDSTKTLKTHVQDIRQHLERNAPTCGTGSG
ncbi:hypothetical protein MMC07_004051 [Pseudocyphellaria aurata]|nr:hypothetical protein [Pseudocyphellaria aurata]